jgi:flagellar capping protein FliD
MTVTNVEYGGELPEATRTSTAAQAPRSASTVAKIYAASAWAFRADNAQRRTRYARLAQPLVQGLSRSLGNFSNALNQFQWPANDSPISFGRVVVRSPGLDNNATATALAAGEAPRLEKLLSIARAPDTATSLASSTADTDYSITLTQGGESRTVTVTVPAGSDWEGVLNATADAINATDLPVQASVVRQNFAGQKLAGVNKIGMFLDLSVSPGHSSQDVQIADSSGSLVRSLKLTATEHAITPATPARYDLRIDRLAKPSSLSTSVLDHRADSGLSAGEYKLKYDLGDTNGIIPVNIDAGMTWDEVLRRTADAINSSTGQLTAEVKDAQRVSGLARSDSYWTDGKYLEVSLASPKQGQRLSLTEYGGPWLDPVDDFFNPTGALPQNPSPGDSYVASATANGWTAGNIYQYNGATWDETTPAANSALTLRADNTDYFYSGSSWSSTPTGNLLSSLDFQPTANPGSDAQIQVNGQTMTSETGVFSLDQGRLNIAVHGATGETKAITVKEAAGDMAERMSDIVDSFNSLSSLLLKNADLLNSSLPDSFRNPVNDLAPGIADLGLTRNGDATLSFDSAAFESSLTRDPTTTKSQLLDPASGLLTRWAKATAGAQDNGVAKALLPPTLFADLGPPPAEQLRLEESGRLLDVMESTVKTTAKLPDLLDAAKALSGLAETKRSALSSTLLPEGAARLLKLES